MTIYQRLIALGCEVFVSHFRPIRWDDWTDCDDRLYNRYDLRRMGAKGSAFKGQGGMTIAVIAYPDGTADVGAAFCSKRDNFCRKTGRELALSRALVG